MRVRQLRIGLKAAAGLLWLGAALALSWAICGSAGDISQPASQTTDSKPTKAVEGRFQCPALKDFEQVWRKPLRRPLFDPPPPAAVAAPVVAPQPPPLPIKLLGTAIELEHSLAMLAMPPNVIRVCRVGDCVGQAPNQIEILEIEADWVAVRSNGEKLVLKREGNKGN